VPAPHGPGVIAAPAAVPDEIKDLARQVAGAVQVVEQNENVHLTEEDALPDDVEE
jgi:hypothetical protein